MCSHSEFLNQRPAPGAMPADFRNFSARVEQMVQMHLAAIWRTAGDLGIALRDRDDVAQDVLLVAMRRLNDIEPGCERAFLLATTVRVAANWRRGNRRRPLHLQACMDEEALGPSSAGSSSSDSGRAKGAFVHPERAAEQNQELALVQEALDTMTESQRVAFTLFELEQLSAREIAIQLGLSEATVFARVRRARDVFRRACESLEARDAHWGKRV